MVPVVDAAGVVRDVLHHGHADPGLGHRVLWGCAMTEEVFSCIDPDRWWHNRCRHNGRLAVVGSRIKPVEAYGKPLCRPVCRLQGKEEILSRCPSLNLGLLLLEAWEKKADERAIQDLEAGQEYVRKLRAVMIPMVPQTPPSPRVGSRCMYTSRGPHVR